MMANEANKNPKECMKERKVAKKKITAADFEIFDERFQQGMDVARALDARQPIPHSITRSPSLM
jgi:hypothetical protein